jgi:hypothetical protein
MITKMFDAIEEVLHSLNVGGEQSRQFAGEIKTLKSVIGYPGPPEDMLEKIERRGLLVRKLRLLAVEAEGLTASLPVAKWLDGTIEDATKDVYFEDYDLAKLLQFISDVGISYED